MTDETAIVTLVTLVITTAGGVVTQLIGMRKAERAARAQIAKTRAEASLLAAQTKRDVEELAAQTERNKEELRQQVAEGTGVAAQVVKKTTDELKGLVRENTELTLDSADMAKKAFHEANQVNAWRDDVNAELAKQGKLTLEMIDGNVLTYKQANEMVAKVYDDIRRNSDQIKEASLVAKKAYLSGETSRREVVATLHRLTLAINDLSERCVEKINPEGSAKEKEEGAG